jgi:hypothetical protein
MSSRFNTSRDAFVACVLGFVTAVCLAGQAAAHDGLPFCIAVESIALPVYGAPGAFAPNLVRYVTYEGTEREFSKQLDPAPGLSQRMAQRHLDALRDCHPNLGILRNLQSVRYLRFWPIHGVDAMTVFIDDAQCSERCPAVVVTEAKRPSLHASWVHKGRTAYPELIATPPPTPACRAITATPVVLFENLLYFLVRRGNATENTSTDPARHPFRIRGSAHSFSMIWRNDEGAMKYWSATFNLTRRKGIGEEMASSTWFASQLNQSTSARIVHGPTEKPSPSAGFLLQCAPDL